MLGDLVVVFVGPVLVDRINDRGRDRVIELVAQMTQELGRSGQYQRIEFLVVVIGLELFRQFLGKDVRMFSLVRTCGSAS